MKIYPGQSSAAGHARRSVLSMKRYRDVMGRRYRAQSRYIQSSLNTPTYPVGAFLPQPSGLRIIWIVVLKSLARVFTRAAAVCVEAANQAEGQCARYDYSGLE